MRTQSVGSVGAFTVAGGIVSNGNKDVNRGGTFSSLTFTGSFNAPDSATGRGSGTFTDSSPATSSFIYYIVDANNIRFLAQTVGVTDWAGLRLQSWHARALRQLRLRQQGRHARLSERGKYGGPLHRQRRHTSPPARATRCRMATLPSMSVSPEPIPRQPTAAPLVTLTTAANNNLVVWMVSPARGFFLVNDPNTVQDGSLDLQQISHVFEFHHERTVRLHHGRIRRRIAQKTGWARCNGMVPES